MTFSITPLLVGLRSADQGMMTYQSDYGKPIWLPMWSFLLQGDDHRVLVDTGLEDFMVPPGFTGETGLTPLYMEEALLEAGLTPDDIHIVINTHLHDDHCGNNPMFSKAEFYIQASEVNFCKNPHPLDDRYDEDFIKDLPIVSLEGDQEILPGLKVFFTPGHTPGSQTVLVQTEEGPVVIPGLCCNAKNFPQQGKAVCPGVHGDAYQAYDSAQRVKELGGRILPLHEVTIPEMLKLETVESSTE